MNSRFHKRRNRRTSITYSNLEPRQLLAGVTIETVVGRPTLLIDGSSQADTALVTDAGTDQVQVSFNGQLETFNTSDFVRIRFMGRSGNDVFTNSTNIDSAAFGQSGNDQLTGGNGHNWIQGGDGNDRIIGGDKNDNLRGRDGDDVIRGGKRHDRIFGGEGIDVIDAASGNDFIQGESGNDQIFGGNGNDRIDAGDGDDTIDAGSGTDLKLYSQVYDAYTIIGGSTLSVTASVGNEGTDQVTNVETYSFADGNRPVANVPSAAERVTIRPIIVSNSNGSNTAEFFGTDEQETQVKLLIDEIFAQADIDIFWEAEITWNNTFANVGDGGTRPTSDLATILDSGDDANIGSASATVIDLYFVDIVPGFSSSAGATAHGLANVSAPGIAAHVAGNQPSSSSGRDIIAGVIAHEIGHNLGLGHVSSSTNLMFGGGGGGNSLSQSQINSIVESDLSQSN